MIPATQPRIGQHTPSHVNARIEREALAAIEGALRDDRIAERLQALDREWDTERTLQLNFSAVVLASLALAFVDRRWLGVSALASAFMVQHAVQGWCPPLALFRRMGIRGSGEIERERAALRALRRTDRLRVDERSIGAASRARSGPARQVQARGGEPASSLKQV